MNTATKTFTAIFRNPDELFVIKKQKSYRIRNLNICYSTFRRVPVRHLPYPMYKISGFIDFLNQLPTVILNGPWYVTCKNWEKIKQNQSIIKNYSYCRCCCRHRRCCWSSFPPRESSSYGSLRARNGLDPGNSEETLKTSTGITVVEPKLRQFL